MAKKPFYLLTTKDTVPQSDAKTGTFTTSGKVVTGSGTSFLTEVKIGDWLVNLAGDEVAEVIKVNSDTQLEIKFKFSSDVAAATAVRIVDSRIAKVMYMELSNDGGVDTTIDGETFLADKATSFGQPNVRGERHGLVVPKVVDGATSNVTVNIEWWERDTFMGFR